MSKKNKFGKVIAVTAIIGTAAAAIATYLHKSGTLKACKSTDDDSLDIYDDEFLDEDFDFPEEEGSSREYITINKSEAVKEEAEDKPVSEDTDSEDENSDE